MLPGHLNTPDVVTYIQPRTPRISAEKSPLQGAYRRLPQSG